jgi:hypothetical protein
MLTLRMYVHRSIEYVQMYTITCQRVLGAEKLVVCVRGK